MNINLGVNLVTTCENIQHTLKHGLAWTLGGGA